MREEERPQPVEVPYRPWRLLVLIGWVAFVLVHDRRISGVELEFVWQLVAAIVLMVLSWFAMPNRRSELLAIAVLIAIGVVGFAADLTMTQKIALIGLVMMAVIAYALWLLRHASRRLRMIVVGLMLAVIALEFFVVGFEMLAELAASA